jgi:hypothetical protein
MTSQEEGNGMPCRLDREYEYGVRLLTEDFAVMERNTFCQ